MPLEGRALRLTTAVTLSIAIHLVTSGASLQYFSPVPFELQLQKQFSAGDLQLKNLEFLVDSSEAYFPERLSVEQQRNADGSESEFLRIFTLSSSCSAHSAKCGKESLQEVANATRNFLQANLHKHGVIVLRGLPLHGKVADEKHAQKSERSEEGQRFEYSYSDLLRATGYNLTKYVGGVTARKEAEPMVYPASDEDPSVCMDLHQDNTYWPVPPAKLLFYYEQPAQKGGLNPLLDMRLYARRLYEHEDEAERVEYREIAQKFERLGVRYENFYPDASVDGRFVPWQKSFGTEDRAEVETNLRDGGFEFEWCSGGGLRKWNVKSPWKQHPITGEKLWVNMIVANHASYFHAYPSFPELQNITYQEVQSGEITLPPEFTEYPFNIRYGDGTEVPYSVIQKLRKLAWETATAFKPEAGDVLVIDNYLAQHGRLAFVPPRKMWLGISLN